MTITTLFQKACPVTWCPIMVALRIKGKGTTMADDFDTKIDWGVMYGGGGSYSPPRKPKIKRRPRFTEEEIAQGAPRHRKRKPKPKPVKPDRIERGFFGIPINQKKRRSR